MTVSTLIKKVGLGLVALLAVPVIAHAVELDRVVAVVNDEPITASELSVQMVRVHKQLASRGTPAPAESQLRQQVLDRMVMDRILLQTAKSRGIKVEDEVLDRAIQRIAEQNKMSVNDLPKAVTEEGFTWPQFRANIREQIVMSRLRERDVDSTITVSDAEVDALLASGAMDMQGREYLIAHIFLRAPESASPEQVNALQLRARDILRQIRGGEDFAKLAATYSAAQDAMQGGMLDWRPLNRLPGFFAQQVVGMRKGEVSDVLQSQAGLHIFKLVDIRDAEQKKVEIVQTHARHILIRRGEGVDEAKVRRRLEDLVVRLRNGGDFAELARTNSADISAAKGGDLGWLSPGDTVPEFERAMDALKPGEVSGVVASQYGWHIIQVIERKTVDVTADHRRMEARQALRDRKSEAAYEDWLRQMRDSAWVEIKPE